MIERIKKIFDNLDEKVDVILIKSSTRIDYSFYYVTGLEKGIFENCSVLVYEDGLELICSKLEEESAKSGNFDMQIFDDDKEQWKMLKKRLEDKKVGINSLALTYKDYLKLKKCSPSEIVDVGEAIKNARMVKDAKEIELIRKACEIASDVANEIPLMLKKGIRECDIAAEINYLIQKKGASPAFDTIVAFGKNSAEPHYLTREKKLMESEVALLDFGACYKRYRSDITRSFILGKKRKWQEEINEIVLEARSIAFDLMKEGTGTGEVHKAVKEFIDGTKFKGKFVHSTGHSIGLEVHDGGLLHPNRNQELKEGMVFTVEPGIYIPGKGGIRVEDDVLIKKDGIEILTE